MKGFLGGVSIGAIVAVAGAAMWSLSSPMPARVQVDATTPDPSEQPSVTDTTAPVAEGRRDADLVEAAPNAPQTGSDSDQSPLSPPDTSPGTRPVIATADGASAGDTSAGAQIGNLPQQPEAVASDQGAAVVPDLQGQAGQESGVVVSTETAALPPPIVEPVETVEPANTELTEGDSSMDVADAATPDQELGTGLKALPNEDVDASQSVLAAETPEARPEITPETSPEIATSAPSVTVPQIGSAPEPTSLPEIAGISKTPDLASSADSQDEELQAQNLDVPDSAAADSTTGSDSNTASDNNAVADDAAASDAVEIAVVERPEAGSLIGTRVVPLTERAKSENLIGGGPKEGLEASDLAPFEANAQAFVAFDDRPLMSIVLIDDAAAIGAEALAEFPYPLTFAIDPDDPKATEKMQARRDAGFEVLILADLPREAAPQDAETSLAVWMERLPQAVGFLEGVETGFQGNRPLADQMVTAMKASGYGMVTQNSGLNTVQKLALRDGMPSGVVFRDFDGAGQNPRAIRRFLDQAAFRARQEGSVIMLGRLRPETISALLLWGLQDRASQVGLAPVSAGLKANLTAAE
ncbi:divergent polysaccharide deacetylase family protein [Pseudophaeobacter leonis]|uniref:divergent polysaccharide deacetylase family protein n=1 Tax=Pseudophaeobacter leonis TaxID=1144477 RepID=UPI0009F236EC|nr:divergent polysaccharide deacetylase family protein [Pseudophaeobacter leonis]